MTWPIFWGFLLGFVVWGKMNKGGIKIKISISMNKYILIFSIGVVVIAGLLYLIKPKEKPLPPVVIIPPVDIPIDISTEQCDCDEKELYGDHTKGEHVDAGMVSRCTVCGAIGHYASSHNSSSMKESEPQEETDMTCDQKIEQHKEICDGDVFPIINDGGTIQSCSKCKKEFSCPDRALK